MSSRIEPFECRWRVSPILLAASLALWALALLSILLAALPVWLKPPLALVCLAYGAWGLYRQVLLRGSRAFRGVRHDERGWQLWSAGSGWQAVQLRPDSLALPLADRTARAPAGPLAHPWLLYPGRCIGRRQPSAPACPPALQSP
ncbi:Uncharacterised protein [Pseudomonas aeruginosa]|nr:Uncharacterised protein [Pseudomonas aeruginosa]